MKNILIKTGFTIARIIFAITLFMWHCYAQDKPELQFKTVTPTPPELTSLGRYTLQPPDLSNGRVQQMIHLVDITDNGVSFPLNLYYNYSGFRLKEGTTKMGLGWGLTEGTIIKIVKHVDDDCPFLLKRNWEVEQNEEMGSGVIYDDYTNLPSTMGNSFSYTLNRLYYKMYDAQPDLYIYNFNGYTGKFFYINEKVVNLEHNDLKIERISNTFHITTPDGLEYDFSPTDITFMNDVVYARTCSNSYVVTHQACQKNTGWKLSKIYNPNTNGSINFTYKQYQNNVHKSGEESHAFTIIGTDYNFINAPGHFTYDNFREDESNYNTSYTMSMLETIETKSMLLQVVSGALADDPVSEIKLFHKSNLSVPVQTIRFEHEYFGNSTNIDTRWLKLKSIKIDGGGKNNVYTFSYVDESYQSDILKLSGYCIDHWGYFNGKYMNQSLYPSELKEIISNKIHSTLFNWYYVKWADRSYDFNYAKKFALEKVVFPTKGYVKYDYESANEYGIRVNHIEENDGTKSAHRYYSYAARSPYKPNYSYTEYYINFWCKILGIHPYNHIITFPVYTMSTLDYGDDVVVYNSEVTELYGDLSGSEGKIEYVYQLFSYPFNKPVLTEKHYLDSNSKTVKTEKFGYSEKELGSVTYWTIPEMVTTGMIVGTEWCYTPEAPSSCQPYEPLYGYPYILGSFSAYLSQIHAIWLSLSRKEITENGVTSYVEYHYRPLASQGMLPIDCNVVETLSSGSNGANLKTVYKYPNDTNTDPISKSMIARNMIGVILEQSDYKGNTPLLTSKYIYYTWPNSQIKLQMMKKENQQNSWTEWQCYNYDNFGNQLYISHNDADQIVYLWSYNYQYPIAEIKGATYADVKAALGNYTDTQVETLAAQATPNVISIDSQLRTYFKDKPALVTTYTYQPLVGMLTITDPRGVVTKYDYDSFGRLIKITQADKVIETYDYHYR